jgi:hypothetical protein
MVRTSRPWGSGSTDGENAMKNHRPNPEQEALAEKLEKTVRASRRHQGLPETPTPEQRAAMKLFLDLWFQKPRDDVRGKDPLKDRAARRRAARPGTRKPRGRRKRKITVLCWVSPMNDGLVFATPKRAAYVERLMGGILGARTWAEYRKAMPRSDYSRAIQDRLERGKPRPKLCDPFTVSDVPGFEDGDFPPRLQNEMFDDLIPPEIFELFGTMEPTCLNGDIPFIDPVHLPAIKDLLAPLGFVFKEVTHQFIS